MPHNVGVFKEVHLVGRPDTLSHLEFLAKELVVKPSPSGEVKPDEKGCTIVDEVAINPDSFTIEDVALVEKMKTNYLIPILSSLAVILSCFIGYF